jgi:dynein heavy chain
MLLTDLAGRAPILRAGRSFFRWPPGGRCLQVMRAKADDPSALHVVLFQEVERYNALLLAIRRSCTELQRGIRGLVVMSADLDAVFDALYNSRVPQSWLKAYPSLKALGPWTADLLARIEQLARWVPGRRARGAGPAAAAQRVPGSGRGGGSGAAALVLKPVPPAPPACRRPCSWVEGSYPNVFWLSGFTYPTGFLTAVLQTTARRNGIPIDTLSFEFAIVNALEADIAGPPKEGVYVRGLSLEGAGWDYDGACLCEPNPMELVVPMPIVLFKPVEARKNAAKGLYSCPLYMYPVRTGARERPSFMINVELRSGQAEPEHWVMRGTALLLSLAA